MRRIVLAVIRLYQRTVSRVLPASCRFTPSCSEYGYQAVEKYGLLRGGWLAVRRIGRCHPLSPGGYDPVP
jgi:putative membrane protein insertion efficiency factor